MDEHGSSSIPLISRPRAHRLKRCGRKELPIDWRRRLLSPFCNQQLPAAEPNVHRRSPGICRIRIPAYRTGQIPPCEVDTDCLSLMLDGVIEVDRREHLWSVCRSRHNNDWISLCKGFVVATNNAVERVLEHTTIN